MRLASAEEEVARATFRIEAQRDRNRFEQCRFSRAVLADEESDRPRKSQRLQVNDRRQREGIAAEIGNLIAAQADFAKIGFRAGQLFCRGHYARGNVSVNVLPAPTSLSAVSSPPIRRASSRLMARPSPTPCWLSWVR